MLYVWKKEIFSYKNRVSSKHIHEKLNPAAHKSVDEKCLTNTAMIIHESNKLDEVPVPATLYSTVSMEKSL